MALTEQGGSRLGPAESGDQSHLPGNAPGESRRLSQACACLYVCMVVVQQARLWPVEPLNPDVHGGCFILLLRSVSGCCSASGGLRWLGGYSIMSRENKPQRWECLNLFMLQQIMVLSSFLEIFLGQAVGEVLVFPTETLVVLGRIPRRPDKSCFRVQSSS